MSGHRREQALVRPHVVTEGRAHPTRNTLDVATVVLATWAPVTGLSPEKRRVMELCRGGALAVAEVAAHLELPTSVTKVLLSDLLDTGHIESRAPVRQAEIPDHQLLQKVLDGLRALT